MTAMCGLLLSVLLISACAAESPDAANEGTKTLPMILTNENPSGSFPVAPETQARVPAILSLSVIKVVNPEETSFGVLVYLVRVEKGGPELQRVLIGNFGLYPPNHAASFLLRASHAFHKLEASAPVSKAGEVRLLLELRQTVEAKPWTPVAVTVAPPQWRNDELQ